MPTLVLEILDGIAIDGFLPDAPHGQPYSATLHGYGSTAPEQWAVVDGALPPGWTLDPATGEVTGDGDTGGNYDVTIMLSDVLGYYTTRRFQFRVGYAPIIVTGGPFEWPVGAPVNDHLTITGGSGVYTEFRPQINELPPGVTATIVGSQVVFSGTPAAPGSPPLVYHVYDDVGGFGFGSFSWESEVPELEITGAFPDWTVGEPATGALTISGGVPPYSGLSVTAGALPSGVSLSIVGNQIVPSGTPTVAGPWSATVQVSDAAMTQASTGVGGEVVVLTQTVWDASNKASDILLSNGNRDAESTEDSAEGGTVISESGHTTGKFYAEVSHIQMGPIHAVGAGLKRGSSGVSEYLGSDGDGWAAWVVGGGGNLGATIHNGTTTNTSVVWFDLPSTMRLAVNIDEGKLWLSRFGESDWIGGGDPATGTSPTFTFTPGGTFYLAASPRSGSSSNPTTRGKLRLVLPEDWSHVAPSGFGMWT